MAHPSDQRRTFAIISHPDAGKTTLTEKLLLYGGAVHQAGAVKSRKAQRAATSDWMDIEKKRGISVTSSVLQFKRGDVYYNLLDTPGHQDFSEDTYRTLTAADCAIMLIDAAKGVEAQTRKLFDVCRKRGTPIVTFVNKLDRPARDSFALMSEVEEVLGIHTTPRTWPIGSGDLFKGVYDLEQRAVLLFENVGRGTFRAPVAVKSLDDPSLAQLIGDEAAETLRAEIELLEGAGEPYQKDKFLRGQQTPVFFGSALTNFGIEPFLDSFVDLCPRPGPQLAGDVLVEPTDERFSGFVFKVQANMDPAHRDRIAFLRVCSGKFSSDMEVLHFRLNKTIRLKRPQGFFGQERETIDEAWAGDVIGLFDPGMFRIGDTLSTGGPLSFDSVPRFSPEHFARLRLLDPMKRKQLQKGIEQLAEEGTVQLFTEKGREKDPILGVVGRLQFEVLTYRLEHEYGAKAEIEQLPFQHARWVDGPTTPEELTQKRIAMAVMDVDGRPVALMRNDWELSVAMRDNPSWKFNETAPIRAAE
ncbi:MAG TPA: peptide chain release factor 3 [Polyangiales bacterium]